MPKFARVLVDQAARVFDKPFDYQIPHHLSSQIQPGVKVLVPFGQRKIAGYVLETTNQSQIKNLKSIMAPLSEEPLFNEELLNLARWLAENYFCYLISALKTVVIFGQKPRKIQMSKSKIKKSKKPPLRINLKTNVAYQKKTAEILNDIEKQNNKKILLLGEKRLPFYLKLCWKIVRQKKSVIVIMPEEFLIEPVFAIFEGFFPKIAAFYKSTLSPNENFTLGEKIKSGQIKILIGTRSAIFTPFKNLGAIIIDQEENSALKQEKNPRYETGKIAEIRAAHHGALLVFGTSSPTLETYYKTKSGEITRYDLPSQKNEKIISVIDLNEEKKQSAKKFQGSSRLIPLALKIEISHALSRKKPVLIFLNRLGYFTAAFCKNCGQIFNCPKCQKHLTYNRENGQFVCPVCGATFENLACPACQASQISSRGLGIERLTGEFKKLFPATHVIKIDRLAVKNPKKLAEIFKQPKQGIFVATRSGIKLGLGFHFKLIGCLGFDNLLNLPDFRAEEKLFQLLGQFFSEYFKKPEKLILVTRHPKHLILKALAGDFTEFYEKELLSRKELNYPPFSSLIILEISCRDAQKIQETQELIKSAFADIEIMSAPSKIIFKISDFASFQPKLKKFLAGLDAKINVKIDTNPREMF